MSWAQTIARVVGLLAALVAWLKERSIRKAERDAIELEGRKELDRLDSAAGDAQQRVQPDDIEQAKSDPNNRRHRRKGSAVQPPKGN